MVVIGAGRVGLALHARSNEVGIACDLITRDSGWEGLEKAPGVPILVATRNNDLKGVIERVPSYRREDLVFVQNGMIRPLLAEMRVPTATRGLLFFAVTSRGAAIEKGETSPFTGAHARAMVGWFVTMGQSAEIADWAHFSSLEAEKLIWNSAFGLLCQRFDIPVGEVCTERRGMLRALVAEMRDVVRAGMNVDMPLDHLMERLVNYSMTIPNYKGAVKEWEWRNGWFVETAARYNKPLALHEELMTQLNA